MNEWSASATGRAQGSLRGVATEALAGLVGSVVLITNIVSFSALMFPGALAAGAPTAIWALLVGSGIVGLWVASKTSLPPMATGIDSPTGAVLVLLAAAAGPAVLSAGGTTQQAIGTTLLLFTAASALAGALMLGLGLARRGSSLRFVPFFVVAGFLGGTGWLLIEGGIRLSTGHGPWGLLSAGAGAGAGAARLACAMAVFGVLLALRRWVKAPWALPVALIVMTLVGAWVLRALGLSDPVHGWYLPSLGTLTPWLPWRTVQADPGALGALLRFVPEMVAVAIVALISLVTKTSSLEVARKASADLDLEMRAHGVSALVAAPLGGIAGSMQLGTSRLLENMGGSTRVSGMVCALVLAAVALLNLDLLALIPLPIAAGLVFQLGWGFLVEAFSKPLAQREWWNLAQAAIIAAACVRLGYVAGIIGGVVLACLLFAASYARLGAVRQHLSRAEFAGNVSRSPEATQFLGEAGTAIQIYWLSGYIFFGSSESVFERVQRDLRALPPRRPNLGRHVILDFAMVSAADGSATVSLAKLRNFCHKQGVTLVFSSLAPRLRHVLEREGFFKGPGARAPFTDVTAALAWAEDALLARGGVAAGNLDAAGAEAWLQQQLGAQVRVGDLLPYLERRSFGDGEVLYRQGEAADAIDLVVSGRLAVDVSGAGGAPPLRLRSITTQTVIGEMGFFGHTARSATVAAEGPATVLTLTRAGFERLRRERPDVAGAFYEFLLRALSERIRMSERMALALRQ
jgi:SulP family sulfate permease